MLCVVSISCLSQRFSNTLSTPHTIPRCHQFLETCCGRLRWPLWCNDGACNGLRNWGNMGVWCGTWTRQVYPPRLRSWWAEPDEGDPGPETSIRPEPWKWATNWLNTSGWCCWISVCLPRMIMSSTENNLIATETDAFHTCRILVASFEVFEYVGT